MLLESRMGVPTSITMIHHGPFNKFTYYYFKVTKDAHSVGTIQNTQHNVDRQVLQLNAAKWNHIGSESWHHSAGKTNTSSH